MSRYNTEPRRFRISRNGRIHAESCRHVKPGMESVKLTPDEYEERYWDGLAFCCYTPVEEKTIRVWKDHK